MINQPKEKKSDWTHLAWAIGGALAGSWLVRENLAWSKKSKAEQESPEDSEAAYNEIAGLLEDWEPEDCVTENDYTWNLAEYLVENTDWAVEVFPDSPEGKPDILIGDLIALELKVNLNKSESDRCIGQCAGYSRLWMTWMVIIDSPASTVGRLEDLLKDKGLEHILVWEFSEDDAEF